MGITFCHRCCNSSAKTDLHSKIGAVTLVITTVTYPLNGLFSMTGKREKNSPPTDIRYGECIDKVALSRRNSFSHCTPRWVTPNVCRSCRRRKHHAGGHDWYCWGYCFRIDVESLAVARQVKNRWLLRQSCEGEGQIRVRIVGSPVVKQLRIQLAGLSWGWAGACWRKMQYIVEIETLPLQ